MAQTDFLSFLVDETFKLHESGVVESSGLDLKLHDYGLMFLKGEFIPQTQMIRFKSPHGFLDMPINWSVFNPDSGLQDVVLSSENDQDALFSVMKTCWNFSMNKMLVMNDGGFCYLIALRVEDESHLHDLLNPQEWLQKAA